MVRILINQNKMYGILVNLIYVPNFIKTLSIVVFSDLQKRLLSHCYYSFVEIIIVFVYS